MEIDRDTFDAISKMLSSMGPNSELECKYKGDIDRDAFTKLIQYCKSTGMSEKIHEDQLDIFCQLPTSPVTYRISLNGRDAISLYCKTNNLPQDVTIINKKNVKGIKKIPLEDLGFVVDLKTEVPCDDITKQEIMTRVYTLDKGYRYKKRFSYEDKNVRYDFSLVKTSKINRQFLCHKGFATSGVVSAKETYEAEVEYMNAKPMKKGKVSKTSDDSFESLVQAMLQIVMVIKNEKNFVSSSAKEAVLQNYLNLVYGNNVNKEELKTSPRSYFAAPQPVTLERQNIVKHDVGVVSIQKDYTVTEKADGERCLMFVNNDGRCYFIDSRLNLRFTGVKLNNLVNTLIDGEYITHDVVGDYVNMYGIFDVYFYNSQNVKNKPLVPDRINIMKEIEKKFQSKFDNEGKLEIFTKTFLYGDDIFKLAKTILQDTPKFAYKIDGLIFTPAYFAVGANHASEQAPASFGTWDKVFKYKPPEENTIDFLVQFGMLFAKDNKLIQEVELFVGYNPSFWERIKPIDVIEGKLKRQEGYIAKRFEPADITDGSASSAYLEINPDKTIACINGDIINDNTIVEFAWHNNNWVPTRVRKDKTELFKKQGMSRTANDIKSAMNTWRSIREPVTHEMITGDVTITEQDINDDDMDTYYFRSIARDKMATKKMLDFHNHWIKKTQLIQKYKGKSIFDIACGQAGDLNKWVSAGFKHIVGIDYSRDNIENPSVGAYSRTLRKLGKTSNIKYIYLTLDGGRVLDKAYFDTLKVEDDKKVALCAWGYEKSNSKRLQEYYKFVKPGSFDVVSCQFAIHYFFESDNKLNSFLHNVNTYLAPGGYFIGTCLDGKELKRKFEQEGNELSGIKNGRHIWNVRRKGENEIEIYMESIGKRFKEYLVDFDVLVDKLAKYNIVLDQPIKSFKTAFEEAMHDESMANITSEMSDVEKTYSFLNSYFVFRKQA